MADCPICDGRGIDPDHDPCGCDDGTPCPACPECKGTGVDPVNRCEFCGAESEDGCHACEVHWCGSCRYEHKCSNETRACIAEGCVGRVPYNQGSDYCGPCLKEG
jgi:hypothetical protein